MTSLVRRVSRDPITKAQTLGLNIRPALGWNDDPQEHYLVDGEVMTRRALLAYMKSIERE